MKTKNKRSSTAGPLVNCAHGKLVPTGKLKPNPGNPNKHPPEQLALYAKILIHQGWRKPIVVSKQTGLIVTGHGAWLTAKKEGWPTVPVDYQDFESRADELAHMLADNRLPQMSEFDDEALSAIIEKELQPAGLDLDLTGYDFSDPAPNGEAAADLADAPETVKKNLEHLADIKQQRKKGNENIISKTDTEYYLVIAFPDRAAKAKVLKRLGLPEDERYLDPANVLILPAASGAGPNKRKASRPKASPPNKSGACG